jgi:phage-related tail fiber protein
MPETDTVAPNYQQTGAFIQIGQPTTEFNPGDPEAEFGFINQQDKPVLSGQVAEIGSLDDALDYWGSTPVIHSFTGMNVNVPDL